MTKSLWRHFRPKIKDIENGASNDYTNIKSRSPFQIPQSEIIWSASSDEIAITLFPANNKIYLRNGVR